MSSLSGVFLQQQASPRAVDGKLILHGHVIEERRMTENYTKIFPHQWEEHDELRP